MKLPMLEHDKANHFIYGLIIFGLFKVILGPIVGIIVCILFGIGKEIYDHFHIDHTPDIYDAIITIAGGVIGLLIGIF
jgi:hypothetical protein